MTRQKIEKNEGEGLPLHPDGKRAMYFLRITQLLDLVPVSRATIYRWVDVGDFPAPVKLSMRMSAWRSTDVSDWMENRAGMAMVTSTRRQAFP